MHWKDERELDRTLGIDTSLTDKDWTQRDRHPCQPSPLAALEAAARWLKPEDHVVDCGCGAGRALFYFAHDVGCSVVGVESDARRMALARENLRRCERHYPNVAMRIALVEGSVEALEFGEGDVLYCFNPFPAKTLRNVLTHEGPRMLLSYYPDDGWRDPLEERGWVLKETIDLRDRLGNDPRERLEVWTTES